jgi:CheY-like chemotaxis protein
MGLDDNPFNLVALEMIFSQELPNYDIEKVTYGQDAIDMIVEREKKTCCVPYYRMIFVDINMPIMSGLEVRFLKIQRFK